MMSATRQTLVTLKVRGGMNDQEKRRIIGDWISEQKCAVAILTECHGKAASLPYYRRSFLSSARCLSATDVFSGVGIMCVRESRIISEHCFVPQLDDLNWGGRALTAKIEINGSQISVVGIYALSQTRWRVGFFEAVSQWMTTLLTDDEVTFIAGNFNCTSNPRVDRHPPRITPDIGSNELNVHIGRFGFIDVSNHLEETANS